MDKSKWEYKPFEDCIEKSKKTKQLMTSDYQPEGSYPIISQEASLISGYTDDADYVNHYDRPIIVFGDHTRVLKYVDFDFAVGADGVKILIPNATLNAKFLLNYLTWYKIPNLGYSRHYKLLKDISIPIPPISDQQRIVAELDCLNEMIALKQEQLKEFDKLAQSIFYDMFGDPITNEKGWDCSLFGKCIKLRSGDGLSAKDIIPGEYPVYGGNGIVGYHKQFNLDEDAIIIGRVGALCGNVRNVKGRIFVTDNAFILSQLKSFENVFLKNLLEILDLRKFAREAMQPVISNKTLKDVSIILPPLALQQQFAEKIQAIESQKELVKKSIAETQQLLASRMDYYFD